MNEVLYNIETTKEEGRATISINDELGHKKYIHSSIAPSREEALFANPDSIKISPCMIILGCGLGYHLKPIIECPIVKKIIVIDILENIETYAAQYIDDPEFKIAFITGENFFRLRRELHELMSFDLSSGFSILEHPSSIRLFPEFYNECRKIINQQIRKQASNILTKNSFGSLYVRNIAKNFSSIPDSFSLSSLKGLYSNVPALIVSSSPSIDHYLPQIRENASNFIIFCVDSAVSILSKQGIKPDFIISIDPQPWTVEHLIDTDPAIPVLKSLSAYKHDMQNPCFFSLTTHPLCQILDYHFPKIFSSIDSKTGTVAGDAIQTALLMGCSPLYIAGMDLSFPDLLIYSKDSRYNTRFTKYFNTKTAPVETLNMRYIRQSSRVIAENGVHSRNSFLQYRDSVNNLLGKTNTPSFLLWGKGLTLECQTIDSFNEITRNPVPKDQLINKLSTIPTIGSLIDFTTISTVFTDRLIKEAIKEGTGSENVDLESFVKKMIRLV